MSYKVRCDNCGHWLGESAEKLVFVETVPNGAEPRVGTPRDVRNCKACTLNNVFITKRELRAALDKRDRKEVASAQI